MKSIAKTLAFLCILCALFAIPATATSNENLPTEEETKQIITDANTNDAQELYDYVKENNINTNCDLLKCSTCQGDKYATVLYYKDSVSANGYKGLYTQDGKNVSPSSLKGYTTDDFYKGDDKNEKLSCKDGNCANVEVKEDNNDSKNREEVVSENNKDVRRTWSWFKDDKKSTEDEEYTYKIISKDKEDYPDDYLDTDPEELSNKEKIETFLYYYDTGKMNEDSVRECLNHLWGDE